MRPVSALPIVDSHSQSCLTQTMFAGVSFESMLALLGALWTQSLLTYLTTILFEEWLPTSFASPVAEVGALIWTAVSPTHYSTAMSCYVKKENREVVVYFDDKIKMFYLNQNPEEQRKNSTQ